MDFSTADICDEYSGNLQVLNYGFNPFGGKRKICGKIRIVEIGKRDKLL